jgi:hypothetical protein
VHQDDWSDEEGEAPVKDLAIRIVCMGEHVTDHPQPATSQRSNTTMKMNHRALALLTLFAVNVAAADNILLRDFADGLGEWVSSFLYSQVSGDERVEANGEGQLRMFVPPRGDHVRYVPTVDGVVRYFVNEDGRPIEVSVDVLEHTTGAGSVYLLLRFNEREFGKALFFGLGNEGLPFYFKGGTENGINGVSMFWDYRDEASLPDENIRLWQSRHESPAGYVRRDLGPGSRSHPRQFLQHPA